MALNIYIYIYIYIYMPLNIYIYIYIYIYISCFFVFVLQHINFLGHLMYIYIYMCVCVCVCVCARGFAPEKFSIWPRRKSPWAVICTCYSSYLFHISTHLITLFLKFLKSFRKNSSFRLQFNSWLVWERVKGYWRLFGLIAYQLLMVI